MATPALSATRYGGQQ
ncbi:hypothetical protein YPPY64_1652, partial [Yersinia pestis PY-64]